MDRAIALAALGLGATSPNPSVGAVILDASGAGRRRGPHRAAPAARTPRSSRSRAAGDRARGGTAVVTLEPCNHTGRTGPCTGRCSRPASPAWWSPSRSRTRWPPAAPTRCAPPGVEVDAGGTARPRPPHGLRYWLTAVTRRTPVRDLEVRGDAGRAERGGRRYQQVDHVGGGPGRRAPAARRPWTRSSPASARCSPTTPGSDRRATPRRAARSRCGWWWTAPGVPRTTLGSATAPHPPGSRPPRRSAPAAAGRVDLDALLDVAVPARRARARCWKAARRWPARSCAPASSTRSSAYIAPKLLGAGPAALGRRRRRARIDRRHRPGHWRHHPDRAGPAASDRQPCRREPDRCSPASSRNSARSPRVTDLGDAARIAVRGPLVTSDAGHGDSIAVNGVCLTVVDVDGDAFTADVMKETLDRSSLGALAAGDRSTWNAPRCCPPASAATWCRATSTVSARSSPASPGEQWEIVTFALPPALARYVVEKGSITVDGVSLTVTAVDRRSRSR